MSQTFSRDILRTVVAQLCQTIGWHAIQATPLEIMVDFLHRNLAELCKLTHRYTEQFGQTIPNLDHLGLAFQDLGIQLQDLENYIKNVESVACSREVPKYPVERATHLNFLKPGSHEVVHRPVHVHEHLPPMHPDLEEPSQQTSLVAEASSTPSEASISKIGVFKRPGDPLESSAVKRARMIMVEEDRPLHEISSVIMTTSGFLSPAREGKLPESRAPLIPSDSGALSTMPPSYPTVPPEIKTEKKNKKTPAKKIPLSFKKLDKENNKKKELMKDGTQVEKTGSESPVKKLASMKELTKLKALKAGTRKIVPITTQGNPKEFGNFIKNLSKASKQAKSKSEKPLWSVAGPSSSTDKPREANVVDGKLSTEPDKQKLNIFKKISKVKEEKSDKGVREDMPRHSRENSPGLVIDEVSTQHEQREVRLAQIDESIEAVLQQSNITPVTLSQVVEKVPTVAADMEPTSVTDEVEDQDEIYISDTFSPPGTPSTPRTPELPPKIGTLVEKRRKKSKSKSKSKDSSILKKRSKIEHIDLESLDRPKTPESSIDAITFPVFPFYSHLPPAPGLIPPPIRQPLFHSLQSPFPKPSASMTSTSLTHPAMPNLRLPPQSFMQPRGTGISSPECSIIAINPETTSAVKDRSPEKKSKKDKKEDKKAKKKEKKDKMKNKEKGEKKKYDKKEKSKEKKEKKEKKKSREKEEKIESSLPKTVFKLGPVSPRPPTPDPLTRKFLIKPVVKKEEVLLATESTRASSPELARISPLFTRPPKQKNKVVVEVSSSEVAAQSSVGRRPTTPDIREVPHQPCFNDLYKTQTKTKDSTKKLTIASNAAVETVAFYYHASSSSPGSLNASRRSTFLTPSISTTDAAGNKIWICPACEGPDDGSSMIACDDCDAWYHWDCVGVQKEPDPKENWYCRECVKHKQESAADKKKKIRKKN